MSSFDNPEYRWRETFFLFHGKGDRPQVKHVEQALNEVSPRFEIRDLNGDVDGLFTSVTVVAADTYSAIDLSYAEGEDLSQQIEELRQELTADDEEEREKLSRLAGCDMRLDVLHFENVNAAAGDEDEMDVFFDPGALILVINVLSELCNGIGVDPGSATIV